MILVCPTCTAKSRVRAQDAAKPRARTRCGQCGTEFVVAEARREQALDARTQAALARARRGTGVQARSPAERVRAAAAVLLALALTVAVTLDARSRAALAERDVQPALTVAAPTKEGLALHGVSATPYAPQGGAEGLLVVGKVRNGGGAARALAGVKLVVQGPKRWQGLVALGPKRTLEEAPELTPPDLHGGVPGAIEPHTLAPGAEAPFVAFFPGSYEAMAAWQVSVSL